MSPITLERSSNKRGKITRKAKYTKIHRVVKNTPKTPKNRNKWRTLEDVFIDENARSFPKQ
jgi:hypothetical protein